MNLGHTLIIRPGALGDAVLTLPVLRALRSSGALSLTALCTPASWAFLKPASLRMLDFSSADWLGLISEAVSLNSAAQEKLAGIHTAIVYLKGADDCIQALKKAGVRTVVSGEPPTNDTRERHTHAARQLLQPLRAFISETTINAALKIGDQAADEFLAVEERERAVALSGLGLRAPSTDGFFGIHPGSGGRHKRWPAENFARVTKELASRGFLPLVFFGPADDATRRECEDVLPRDAAWTSVANRPLREVLALLTLCRGYVGNDAGLTHLAARVCPVVVLFGPTASERWTPLGRDMRILQAPEKNLSKLDVATVLEAAFEISRR
ncbi:MAG: glycosyltransferase family 9 protein [Planctomycetota bacterium]